MKNLIILLIYNYEHINDKSNQDRSADYSEGDTLRENESPPAMASNSLHNITNIATKKLAQPGLYDFKSALCFVLCTSFRIRRNTQCTSSSQCTTAAPCCRIDSGGFDLPSSGTCSGLQGDAGDICYGLCGCKSGLTCYRPLSGVCCLPKKCYDSAWVQQEELNYANCLAQSNGPPISCLPV